MTMNSNKIIKYILIAILLLFLAKWGIETVIYNANKTPEINPHPTKKVRIYGKFPLDHKKYYIHTLVSYFASNPKCDTQHWLTGASSEQEAYQDFNSTMLDDGYEVIVYDDYYTRGVCNWKIENINLSIVSKDDYQASYVVSFSTNSKIQTKDNNIYSNEPINFICNSEYLSSTDYIRYYCEDPIKNLITGRKVIKISDLQNEFEVNFNQIAEPTKTMKKGE
jgi:hypothetical protein